MKKSDLFLLIFILIMVVSLKFVYSQGSVGVGLLISDISGPLITLIQPINNSGKIHGNLTFFYNVSDLSNVSNCSLIINNKVNATNNSILKVPSENFFKVNDLPVGVYNWSINCTDNLGFIGSSENRTFSVIFMAHFNGTITNLSAVDIRNVTNFVVETTGFGKINFSEGIDLSHGFDLNEHINISFNKIELDSVVLFTLNKSATLQLTGLTFANPRIARDGIVCPDTICKKVSYSGGVLTFNVSHFTSYEAEETPSEAAPSAPSGGGAAGGGGGGGGGGGPPAIPVITEFSVDKTSLKVVLKQGESKKETLKIKNTGTTIFDVKAILEEIGKFKIEPSQDEIVTNLKPNEEKTIEFIFKALENEKPEIYPGRIMLRSPSKAKEVAAIIEVDSAQPLFDVDVEVLPDSKKVFPGQEVSLEVNLFNVRGFGRVDVGVEYSIKDLKGNVIAAEHETLAVETQAKFTRRILVPSYAEPGSYVAFAKVTYTDSVGVSSDLFEVQAKTIRLYAIKLKDYKTILLLAGGILIVTILIFSAYRYGYLRKKAPKTQVEEVKQLKEEDKAQKLKKELEAIESAYKSGFISEESYKKDKKRVEDKLNSLK